MAAEPEGEEALGASAFRKAARRLRVELLNAQFDLRREPVGVLVLLAGDDRVGCGHGVRRLHQWMDARYMATRVFDRPGSAERERPPLYRHWRALLAAGWPVLKLWLHLPRDAQRRRLERADEDPDAEWHVEEADRALVERWEEARPLAARLLARTGTEEAPWRRVESAEAAEEMLARTHAPEAPWHVVPANDKRSARVEALETVADAFEAALARRPRG